MYSSQQAVPNLYLERSVADVASLGSYQHSSDRNSSKRSQGNQCSSSSTHQVDTQVQKKRKLDLVKCGRCRIDKQKCTPTDRIWPNRCERCITKDFPCSEGKRVQRGRKYGLPKPAPSNNSEKGSEEVPRKDLDDLNFLLGYQNILSTASSQLQHLQEENLGFFDQTIYRRRSARDLWVDLNAALESISGITNEMARNQIAFSSQEELRTALSNQVSIGSVLSSLRTGLDFCRSCEEESREESGEEGKKGCEKSKERPQSSNNSNVEDLIENFEQAGSICQEVLVRQARISAMIRCYMWEDHIAEIQDYSAKVNSKISSIISRANCMTVEAKHLSTSTRQVNGYFSLLGQVKNNTTGDFLQRSIAHQLFDQIPDKEASLFLPEDLKLFGVESVYQTQDRLGRTLLHLLCQRGSYECVKQILDLGADPRATTIYGHLPLHYAAKRGDYNICKLLLECRERFNILQRDNFGCTAYDYASWGKHQQIESLLKAAASR